jgi:hypothetical protein
MRLRFLLRRIAHEPGRRDLAEALKLAAQLLAHPHDGRTRVDIRQVRKRNRMAVNVSGRARQIGHRIAQAVEMVRHLAQVDDVDRRESRSDLLPQRGELGLGEVALARHDRHVEIGDAGVHEPQEVHAEPGLDDERQIEHRPRVGVRHHDERRPHRAVAADRRHPSLEELAGLEDAHLQRRIGGNGRPAHVVPICALAHLDRQVRRLRTGHPGRPNALPLQIPSPASPGGDFARCDGQA